MDFGISSSMHTLQQLCATLVVFTILIMIRKPMSALLGFVYSDLRKSVIHIELHRSENRLVQSGMFQTPNNQENQVGSRTPYNILAYKLTALVVVFIPVTFALEVIRKNGSNEMNITIDVCKLICFGWTSFFIFFIDIRIWVFDTLLKAYFLIGSGTIMNYARDTGYIADVEATHRFIVFAFCLVYMIVINYVFDVVAFEMAPLQMHKQVVAARIVVFYLFIGTCVIFPMVFSANMKNNFKTIEQCTSIDTYDKNKNIHVVCDKDNVQKNLLHGYHCPPVTGLRDNTKMIKIEVEDVKNLDKLSTIEAMYKCMNTVSMGVCYDFLETWSKEVYGDPEQWGLKFDIAFEYDAYYIPDEYARVKCAIKMDNWFVQTLGYAMVGSLWGMFCYEFHYSNWADRCHHEIVKRFNTGIISTVVHLGLCMLAIPIINTYHTVIRLKADEEYTFESLYDSLRRDITLLIIIAWALFALFHSRKQVLAIQEGRKAAEAHIAATIAWGTNERNAQLTQ